MTFTAVDGVVLLVLFISAILAFVRGLTRELLSVGGWVIAAGAAFALAPAFEPIILQIPVVGDFVRKSCELSLLTAFAAVFAIALIVLSVLTSALASAVRESALGPIDRGLGFFFGFGRGVILLVIVFLLYDMLVPDGERAPMIEEAASITLIADTADILLAQAPTEMPDWLADWIEGLMGGCQAVKPGIDA